MLFFAIFSIISFPLFLACYCFSFVSSPFLRHADSYNESLGIGIPSRFRSPSSVDLAFFLVYEFAMLQMSNDGVAN